MLMLFEFAKSIVLNAGQHIRNHIFDELHIETKSNKNDLVTNMDKEVERILVSKIKETYPEHRIIGEEGHGNRITDTNGYLWVIDPIDGTLNFVHQKRNFAISVGIFKDGLPCVGLVYDVMSDVLYSTEVGHGAYKNDVPLSKLKNTKLSESIISMNPNWLVREKTHRMYHKIIKDSRSARSYGSAALDFAFVAEGIIDSYITIRLHPWDFAGGMMIATEVGAVTTNHIGEALTPLKSNSVIVANAALHDELLTNYLSEFKDELIQFHQGAFTKR